MDEVNIVFRIAATTNPSFGNPLVYPSFRLVFAPGPIPLVDDFAGGPTESGEGDRGPWENVPLNLWHERCLAVGEHYETYLGTTKAEPHGMNLQAWSYAALGPGEFEVHIDQIHGGVGRHRVVRR